MDILRAPLDALFSLAFYRRVLTWPLRRGFLYLAYLSTIVTLLVFLFFQLHVRPRIDRFVDWAAVEMPPLTWTPEGLVMNAGGPKALTYPDLGPVAIFDMTKQDVTAQEIGDYLIYVTSQKLYIREGPGEIRIYDLTRRPDEVPPDRMVFNLDGERFKNLYLQLRPWVTGALLLLFLPVYFVTKVVLALISSAIGLLINFMRREKLEYARILNACFFAVTAETFLQFRGLLLPALNRIPFGFWGSFLLTGAYLFLALKMTEEKTEPS